MKLQGVFKKHLQAQVKNRNSDGKPFNIYRFILTPLDGGSDIFVNSFKPVDKELLSKTVEVEGEQYNDTTFNLKQSIRVVNGELSVGQTGIAQEVPQGPKIIPSEPPKKRGRKPKNVQTTIDAPVPVRDRESFRKEAEASVKQSLKAATRMAEGLNVDLVELADLIGRTMSALFIGYQQRQKNS